MSQLSILHHPAPSAEERDFVLARLPGELLPRPGFSLLKHQTPCDQKVLNELREQLTFDINPLPAHFTPELVRLIVSDMDSTLIAIECIDELADCLGLKPQVAAITEAAMRGELDFPQALRRRVALLKGLPVEALQQVYEQRLRFNPGAEILIDQARRRGIRTAVVSGGFTFFTERVKARLGMDFALANQLEEKEGRLTGEVLGEICGAEAKAAFLRQLCEELGIQTRQCIAIGDGANDLKMLALAGLGVAYHAKPKVQQQAAAVLNHSGLEGVCHFLGEADE